MRSGVAYQACYPCEVVYEVEADGSVCPQCGAALEPYDYQPAAEVAPAAPAPPPMPEAGPPPPDTMALDSADMEPLPEIGEAPKGGARKSTLLGPPKPVPQPFGGDALGAIDLHHSPVTGNTDPMPAPNIPRPEVPSPPDVPVDLPRTMALSPDDVGDLGPIGVASAQAPSVAPELPRTMALSPDQLDELPPVGGEAPVRPQRTRAMDTGSMPLAEATPRSSPLSRPSEEVPMIAERTARPTGNTERTLLRLQEMRTQPRKRKSKAALIIVISLLILGGAGAAVYFFVFADGAQKKAAPVVETPPPPVELTWEQRLEKQIADGQAVLPVVKGGARLAEGVFVAGGPEGFSTSLGTVTGMASTKIRPDQVKRDEQGAWMPGLRATLGRNKGTSDTDVLSLAIHGEVKAEHLVQMANSGHRAGFKAFALVVERAGSEGELSTLPFFAGKSVPDQGAVIFRVGKLSDYVAVKDQKNQILSAGTPQIPRTADGKPNLEAIAQRLAELRSAHSTVDLVFVYPNEKMTTSELAGLVARIQTGRKGARFEKVALAL